MQFQSLWLLNWFDAVDFKPTEKDLCAVPNVLSLSLQAITKTGDLLSLYNNLSSNFGHTGNDRKYGKNNCGAVAQAPSSFEIQERG